MDEAGGWLVLIALGALAAMAALYVVILLLPFVLYGAAIVLGLGMLRRQCRAYILTSQTYVVLGALLVLVGLMALLVALTVGTSTSGLALLILMITPPAYLGLAMGTLRAWEAAKTAPITSRRARATSTGRLAEGRLRQIRAEMAALEQRNAVLLQAHGERFRERAELEDGIEALVRLDAQILGVRRRALEGEAEQLDEGELSGRLGALGATARASEPGVALETCILALESRRRSADPGEEELRRSQARLDELGRDEAEAGVVLAGARADAEAASAELAEIRRQRIRLDLA